MIHIHCDRCKADIDPEGDIGKMSWGFKKGIEGAITSDLLYGRVYCEKCMDLCMAFIQGHTEPQSAPKRPQRGGRERLKEGEVILKMAADGIKTKEIAFRLGLNHKQVQNYLYHHKEGQDG